MATVSHLPHVLANVLVGEAAAALSEESERLPEVGTSFRDTTRVAGANPAIWGDIFATNRDAVADGIDAIGERLREAAELIRAGDADAVGAGTPAPAEDRRRLLESDLAGGDLRELRIGVENRPGTVAEIALALGHAQVNIEDMALYPAPDMRTGAISVWVAGAGRGRARRRARPRPRAHGRDRRRRGMTRFDPAGPLRGSLTPPPDKSISHRAAIVAAMGEGETRIDNYLDAEDTLSTLGAVEALGCEVERDGAEVRVARRRDCAAPRPARDRRRQRRHPAAAAARLARRAAGRRVDARRRRVDPPPSGRPGGRAAAADGRRGLCPRRPPAAACGPRRGAARDRVPPAGRAARR